MFDTQHRQAVESFTKRSNETYEVKQTGPRQITIEKQGSEELMIIDVEETVDRVEYRGLPEELKAFLINYTRDELLNEPLSIVTSIIRM